MPLCFGRRVTYTVKMNFVLYTRPGCHLCDDAAHVLDAMGIEYQAVDISQNADLETTYGWDIPVLIRDGEIIAKGVFAQETLVHLLQT